MGQVTCRLSVAEDFGPEKCQSALKTQVTRDPKCVPCECSSGMSSLPKSTQLSPTGPVFMMAKRDTEHICNVLDPDVLGQACVVRSTSTHPS